MIHMITFVCNVNLEYSVVSVIIYSKISMISRTILT